MAETVAVILAGGLGLRMGHDIPKQFLPVAGKTSLEHSVAVFEKSSRIDRIIIMVEKGSLAQAQAVATEFSKVSHVEAGGGTRNETAYKSLNLVPDPDSRILFHDAVRPLVTESIIIRCIEALNDYDAVDCVIDSVDTMVQVDADGVVCAIPDRSYLKRGQTPQGFRKSIIMQAYERAFRDPEFTATDDCGVVLKYCPGTRIKTVAGDETNIKLTHPIDVHLGDKLFQLKQSLIGGETGDESFDGQVIVVIGASRGIGADVVDAACRRGAHAVALSRKLTHTFAEDRESVRQALAEVSGRYGKIDHVVLTAGILRVAPLMQMSEEELRHDVCINFMAPLIVAQEAYPYVKKSRGSVLFYTSSSYTRGRAGYTVYSAAKAAVVNLTQALADEWSEDAVRVNCVNPARTATPMRTKAFGQEPEGTLLSSFEVAEKSLAVLSSTTSGSVVDVRLHESASAWTKP